MFPGCWGGELFIFVKLMGNISYNDSFQDFRQYKEKIKNTWNETSKQ